VAKTVAEQFVETLAAAGAKRLAGIVADGPNGLTDAVRNGKIEWIHVRHEEVAALVSCGPGGLHLIDGLFNRHRSFVPVLGVAAHIERCGGRIADPATTSFGR